MKNEIKEITEIITRLQDCGRKRISPTEGVIVNNKDIATALVKAGYRKQSETVKEFAEKACNRMDNYGRVWSGGVIYLLKRVGLNFPTEIVQLSSCGITKTVITEGIDIEATIKEWRQQFCDYGKMIVFADAKLLDSIKQRTLISSKSVYELFYEMGVDIKTY